VFDENGKFVDAWPNVRRPYSFLLTEDQHLWVADGVTQKFTKFDVNGKLLYSWGTFGAFPGGIWGVHQFHTDSEGSLYTADVHVGRPQKFRPKKGPTPRTSSGVISRGDVHGLSQSPCHLHADAGDARRRDRRRQQPVCKR
jgi:hypothetical protein